MPSYSYSQALSQYAQRKVDLLPYEIDLELVNVKCPFCQHCAEVSYNQDTQQAHFYCPHCSKTMVKDIWHKSFNTKNICPQCHRYFNISLDAKTAEHHTILKVYCPYCHYLMPSEVIAKPSYRYQHKISLKGKEYVFGLDLFFLTNFKGHVLFAVNKEHLQYLLSYTQARLREKPLNYQQSRTLSHSLPNFIKSHKNRYSLGKVLLKLAKRI